MREKINWLMDANNRYTKSLRGYDAVIVINSDGTATLSFTANPGQSGVTTPTTATFDTRKLAKEAYLEFLMTLSVNQSTS